MNDEGETCFRLLGNDLRWLFGYGLQIIWRWNDALQCMYGIVYGKPQKVSAA